MKRRRFVQAVSALPAIGLPDVPMNAQEMPKLEFGVPDVGGDTIPRFFTAKQMEALRRLSDLIVPKLGDTPGALEAHAPEFLDFLIGQSPADRQRLYRTGLDALIAKGFDAGLAPLRERWTWNEPTDPLAAFLRAAKADIMMATVNSREWIAVVSQRNRNASGTAIYWRPIE